LRYGARVNIEDRAYCRQGTPVEKH
jgi:hypothetical protein